MEENTTCDWDTNADIGLGNAMKEDYENSKFNSYIKGLGAELDVNLQPGAVKTADKKLPNVQVYIKGISREMNDLGLENLCRSFGKIVQMKSCGVLKYIVRISNSTAFVTCLNINEAERIITSLNTIHHLNITASFAKEKEKTTQNLFHNYDNRPLEKPTVLPEYLDMQNRKIKGPFGAPTQIRPIKKTIEITPKNYGKSPKLFKNDPNMDFCGKIINKFSNCNIMNSDNVLNGVFNYRENSNVLNGIQKMADQKPGEYNPEKILYNYQSSQKNALILPTGKCACCKLPAIFKCVCGEDYCSAVCQKNDWTTHTNVCRPLPKVVPTAITVDVAVQSKHINGFSKPLKNMIMKSSITSNAITKAKQLEIAPFPVSGTNVIITAVINHRCFFIRSLDANSKQEFLKDANDLAAYALTAKPLQKNPEIGEIFLAEFDGAYYRALALHITATNKITVAFIDFGHTAEKSLENLKELSAELMQRKRFTHKIVFKNVPLIMLTEKYLNYLHELVNEMKPLQLKYTDRNDIALIDTDRKISLETYLIQLNDIKKPIKNDEFVRLENLKSIEIKGENIDVAILDTSCLYLGYMACCRADHLNDIIEQNERLQVYCENVRNQNEIEYYTPRQTEVCLVKHIENNQWYRGALVESVGDGNPTIMFIDFGNISIVNNKNILPMPKEFAFPLYTHSCMIKDWTALRNYIHIHRIQPVPPVKPKFYSDSSNTTGSPSQTRHTPSTQHYSDSSRINDVLLSDSENESPPYQSQHEIDSIIPSSSSQRNCNTSSQSQTSTQHYTDDVPPSHQEYIYDLLNSQPEDHYGDSVAPEYPSDFPKPGVVKSRKNKQLMPLNSEDRLVFESQLIDLVLERRPIFDHRIKITQRSAGDKKKLWDEILEILEPTYGKLQLIVVQNIGKRIRDSYRRYYNWKNSKKSGSATTVMNEPVFAAKLSALDEVFEQRTQTGNIPPSTQTITQTETLEETASTETVIEITEPSSNVSKLHPFSKELYNRLIELLPLNSTIKVDKCTLEQDENEDAWPTFTLPEIVMTLKAENLIPCKSNKKVEIVLVKDLIRVKIEGENIKVAILDTSCLKLGYMACCDVTNFNEIIKLIKQLQTYCENIWSQNANEYYTPRKSEVFLVKYTEDKQWYRGTLIESVGNDNSSVMFIDFGNISIVSNKNILAMPKEFAVPLYTHFCMINGVSEFQPLSNELHKRLAELLPYDSTIKVAKSTIAYDANQEPWSTFTLPKIIKTLKSENLIK